MRKALFILGQLNDLDVAWIARTGRRVDAPAGERLISMGVRLRDLIIVLDGSIEVAVGERRLALLGRGEILGEMSLIEKAMPSADARTLAPSTLLLVPMVALRAKLEADAPFAARFYKAVALFLADRMRETIGSRRAAGEDVMDELDELDEQVMDGLMMAGQHFLTVLDSAM